MKVRDFFKSLYAVMAIGWLIAVLGLVWLVVRGYGVNQELKSLTAIVEVLKSEQVMYRFVSEDLMLYQDAEMYLFEGGRKYMTDEEIRMCARIIYRFVKMYGTNGNIPIGLDLERVLSWIDVESGFNPRIESYAGAIGLTQQMPITAKDSLKRYLGRDVSIKQAVEFAKVPHQNLILGLERLVDYQQQFIEIGHASPSDWKLTFSLYQWSIQAYSNLVSADDKNIPKASLKYAINIEKRMSKFKKSD